MILGNGVSSGTERNVSRSPKNKPYPTPHLQTPFHYTVGILDNKVCLITGSTGIAEATALHAAEEGASVFVTSRTETNCRALAEQLGKQGLYQAADLTQQEQVAEVVRACVEQWGRIDGLFNVAGLAGGALAMGRCTSVLRRGGTRRWTPTPRACFWSAAPRCNRC